jgi:hypothetical protein
LTARSAVAGATLAGVAGGALALLARGALTLDLGIGRRVRSLGPLTVQIAAPRDTVFGVISEPYLERAPRALESKLQVVERGADMVLAAHFTPLAGLATVVGANRLERAYGLRPREIEVTGMTCVPLAHKLAHGD